MMSKPVCVSSLTAVAADPPYSNSENSTFTCIAVQLNDRRLCDNEW